MIINTSYFAKIKEIKNPLAICGKSPVWYKGPEYKILAPKYSFFKDYKDGKIDKYEYTKLYYELVLHKLNPLEVINKIYSFYPYEEEITLLCYERPLEFCHRHLVAEFFTKCGFEIKEKEF